MPDKQVFAAIVGAILSAILGGGLLIIPIQLIYEATGHHIDGCDEAGASSGSRSPSSPESSA